MVGLSGLRSKNDKAMDSPYGESKLVFALGRYKVLYTDPKRVFMPYRVYDSDTQTDLAYCPREDLALNIAVLLDKERACHPEERSRVEQQVRNALYRDKARVTWAEISEAQPEPERRHVEHRLRDALNKEKARMRRIQKKLFR